MYLCVLRPVAGTSIHDDRIKILFLLYISSLCIAVVRYDYMCYVILSFIAYTVVKNTTDVAAVLYCTRNVLPRISAADDVGPSVAQYIVG